MKQKRHMPTLWLLLISMTIFTSISVSQKNSIYKNYSINLINEPILTVMMQGLGDRIVPFSNILWNNSVKSKIIETDSVQVFSRTEDSTEISAVFEESKDDANKSYSFETVDKAYFDNALFIGDSRTVGLQDYSGLKNSVYYAKVSSTIFGIMDDPMITVNKNEIPYYGNSTISIRQALARRTFGKIYIMVGINELGTGTAKTFYDQYKKVISDIRALQPNAIIYIQSIMHVTNEKSNEDEIYNNKNIDERNEEIKTISNNHDVFYLNLNEALDDENHSLNSDYTFDSIHLKASKYLLWESYLMKHGIIK